MKIKTTTVTLNSFSLYGSGYLLPTFQQATLKTVGRFWCKKRVLMFSHFKNKEDIKNNIYTKTILRVK